MNAFTLAGMNARKMWRRVLGLGLLVGVSVALCTIAFTVTARSAGASGDRVRESVANRSISVERLLDRPGSSVLSPAAMTRLRSLPHVSEVQPRSQVAFGHKSPDGEGLLLYATSYRSALPPPLTAQSRPAVFPLAAGEAVLPARAQGIDLHKMVGKTIKVDLTRMVRPGEGTVAFDTLKIVGLYDPVWQFDGPDAAYANDQTVASWAALRSGMTREDYLTTVGYDRATVVADRQANVAGLLARVQEADFAATTLEQQLSELPAVLELIKLSGYVLLVVLTLVGLLGAVTVTSALARQRVRELGIMKAIGFTRSALRIMLMAEMGLVGLITAVGGSLLGLVGAWGLLGLLRQSPDLAGYVQGVSAWPPPWLPAAVILLTLTALLLGAWGPSRRASNLDPVDAMREW